MCFIHCTVCWRGVAGCWPWCHQCFPTALCWQRGCSPGKQKPCNSDWCQRGSRRQGKRAGCSEPLSLSSLYAIGETDFAIKTSSSLDSLDWKANYYQLRRWARNSVTNSELEKHLIHSIWSKAPLQPKQTQPCPLPRQIPASGFIDIIATA